LDLLLSSLISSLGCRSVRRLQLWQKSPPDISETLQIIAKQSSKARSRSDLCAGADAQSILLLSVSSLCLLKILINEPLSRGWISSTDLLGLTKHLRDFIERCGCTQSTDNFQANPCKEDGRQYPVLRVGSLEEHHDDS